MIVLKAPFDKVWENKDPFEEVNKLSGQIYRAVATRKTIQFEINGIWFYTSFIKGIDTGISINNSIRLPY